MSDTKLNDGFRNGQDDSALLAALQADAPNLGLFTEANLQALALGNPVLSRSPAHGKFRLVTGVVSTSDLNQPFTPLTGFVPTFDGITGEIFIDFDPPNTAAHFFRVFGTAP